MWKIFAVVCAVIVGASAVSVATASVLDQSQSASTGSSTIFADQSVAQTFVPAITGRLEQVDIKVAYGSSSYLLNVSIVETVGRAPTGTVLGSQQISSGLYGWIAVDFLSDAIDLVAGTEYAIVMASDEPEVMSGRAWEVLWDDDPYPAGLLWNYIPSVGSWTQEDWSSQTEYDADAAFRTHMTPEPTTLGLLAVGAAAMIRRRRR